LLIPISKDLIEDSVLYQNLQSVAAHETAINMIVDIERSLGIIDGIVWDHDKHNDTALRLRLEEIMRILHYDH